MSKYTYKKHNFCAGPSVLPEEVFNQSAEAVIEIGNTGMSILEISHRSKEFYSIMEESISLVREILDVPANYEVLFLQGGASTQFAMVPFNLLAEGDRAGYINTGVWTDKAFEDASLLADIVELASSKHDNFSYIPKEYAASKGLTYVHFASNNTVYGTEFHQLPRVDAPLVSDMSSNIFSKPIQVTDYTLIYAGAQKNLGCAGATLVILDPSAIRKPEGSIPSMWDFRAHISKASIYNTPPVFTIYVCLLTLRWLKAHGGMKEMERRSLERSKMLYTEIDRNPLFEGMTAVEDRSRMNATFRTVRADHEEAFLSFARDWDIVNLKGHRTAGGFRASMYNALRLESVVHLVKCMQEFEMKFG